MIPAVQVQLSAPPWLVTTMLVIVICSAIAQFVLNLYKTQAGLDNWERVQDDADLGARGVEQLTEHLADLREEVTDAMLSHAEQLDELRERLPVKVESVRVDTAEAAAVLVGHWASGMQQRPTPHKRARTTEGETTDA